MENSSRWLQKRGKVKKSSSGAIIDTSLERGPRGFVLCRFCGTETKSIYNTFCSGRCVHSFKVRTQPQYLRDCIFKRDRGICQNCKVNCHDIYLWACSMETLETRQAFFCELGDELWLTKAKRCLDSLSVQFRPGMFWEAAHIVDVQDGGGASGLENIRTLCVPCHQKESRAKLMLKRPPKVPLGALGGKKAAVASSPCILSGGRLKLAPSRQRVLDDKQRRPYNGNHAVGITDAANSSLSKAGLTDEQTDATAKSPVLRETCGNVCQPPAERTGKRRPFSKLETDALIVGINQFGNSWAKIKKEYASIFGLRTPVDLKDKARNLAKNNPNYLNL